MQIIIFIEKLKKKMSGEIIKLAKNNLYILKKLFYNNKIVY